MMIRRRFTTFLLPLMVFCGASARAADVAAGAGPVKTGATKEVIIIPAVPGVAGAAQANDDTPRAQRKTPKPRDPSRGMYDPETEREGDARTLEQLSRDRLNLEGERSRSLEELASPLRERRHIDQSRGRLPLEERNDTSSLRERLSVPDSRREYRIDNSRDLRQEYIEENGSSDFRVYRTR